MKKILLACIFSVLFISAAEAAGKKPSEDVAISTTPIGSPYYRHLAGDFDIDVRELVKFERRGFGRAEIVTLVLLAEADVKKLKKLGNRRIKEKVTLRELTAEEKLNYDDLQKVVQEIKQDIESRPESALPPPVFKELKDDDQDTSDDKENTLEEINNDANTEN